MKKKFICAAVLAQIFAAGCTSYVFASDEINIYTNGAQIKINLNYEKWAKKDVSVFIYSETDSENNEIIADMITEEIFGEVAVYADVLRAGEDGRAEIIYLMRDDDISGNYKVEVSLANGEESKSGEYYYASKTDREHLENEITKALSEGSAEAIQEIFAREGKDFNILSSSGYLNSEYSAFDNERKSSTAALFIKLYSDDTVGAFNEAVVTEIINNAGKDELDVLFEKYSAYTGINLEEDKNYKILKESGKQDVLFEAMEKIEFSGFDDIKKNLKIYGAVSVLNSEESYAEIYDILYSNNDVFELSFDEYNKLSDYYKSVVLKAVTGKNFESVNGLRETFNKAVEDALKDMNSKTDSKKETGGKSSGGGGIAIGDAVAAVIEKNTPSAENEPEKEQENENTAVFNDLEDVEWAREAIEELYRKNIVSGVGKGVFEPSRNIKREEFVKLVVLAFEFEIVEGNTDYEDVKPGQWYEKYIKTALENGIINGISEKRFWIGENITRQDMAVILCRVMDLKSADSDELFSDDAQISEYAKEAVYSVKNAGIISGVGGNMFAPKAPATRAQAAKMIYMGMNKGE